MRRPRERTPAGQTVSGAENPSVRTKKNRTATGPDAIMQTHYLVRHARPAAGWGEDPDPGLDAVGITQAEVAACALSERLDRLPVFSSPMRRCRETATPLEQRWGRPAHILCEVAEIPAPTLPSDARRDWLDRAMSGTWSQLQRGSPAGSPDFRIWRTSLLTALTKLPGDSVIFTHFIAINVIVGSASGNDAVVSFRPDHASVTVVQVDEGNFRIIDLGSEAVTSILTTI